MRGNFVIIETQSGELIDFVWPHRNRYLIEDIAHGLSHVCRFAGHTGRFYSVAQHSVLVSHVDPENLPLWKLMHDASEAYMGDMPTPLKKMMPEYRKLEDTVMDAIADSYGLPRGFQKNINVKAADKTLLYSEKRDLLKWSQKSAELWDRSIIDNLSHERIEPWEPDKARQMFLLRYEEINGDG